ncbi:MAG: DUF2950 domain-containing protein [Syntrophobacteraceae bacterium]|jgi:hypothetical protein
MLLLKKNRERQRVFFLGLAIGIMASLISILFYSPSARGAPFIWPSDAYEKSQGTNKSPGAVQTFRSPEEAVKALVEALSANDEKKLLAIFGPGGKQLISSGDEVADRAGRERFLQAYQEKNRIVEVNSKKAVLEIGNDAWPFPIPINKIGKDWCFSAREGKTELLNRRIGKNELSVIQVSLAYVDAQREYASKDRNGDGVLEYAQKFLSDPGTKDGLYWEAKEGEEQSPLGPLIGEAKKVGYKKKAGDQPSPYHGYFFKILKAQGKSAPRGAYDYVVNGRMVGGFAMVAYPAGYGSSGIKTFIVSHDGVVYEKDLGKNTASIAQEMKKFDPDRGWHKVESKYLDLSGKKSAD